MSRIGKLPITIPAGVTITVSDDNTVNGHGQGDPLIFFDTAVIMGVQISLADIFIKGILFDIQTG